MKEFHLGDGPVRVGGIGCNTDGVIGRKVGAVGWFANPNGRRIVGAGRAQSGGLQGDVARRVEDLIDHILDVQHLPACVRRDVQRVYAAGTVFLVGDGTVRVAQSSPA